MAIGGRHLTPAFLAAAGLAALGLLLSFWREIAGLGPVSGMNDGYSWGLYKNFNVTTLTALGSGGYALGMLVYVLDRRKYHVLMRTALLISILCYTAGMVALAIDVGRPWNMMWLAIPWVWNTHSVLFEVALCMTAYVMIALDLENLMPLLERLESANFPPIVNHLARLAFKVVKAVYPFGVALAFVLPSMHQSSLGSLMYQSGQRVHAVWQTPMLPFLYLLMAWVLGLAFVVIALQASCAVWKLPVDWPVLASVSKLVGWLGLAWFVVRLAEVTYRGAFPKAFQGDLYTFVFLAEMLLVLIPSALLAFERMKDAPHKVFNLLLILCLGGMLYRYSPTTIAFQPGENYSYFPSVTEVLMSVGFVALAVIGYLYTVKRFPILPVPLQVYLQTAENTKSLKEHVA